VPSHFNWSVVCKLFIVDVSMSFTSYFLPNVKNEEIRGGRALGEVEKCIHNSGQVTRMGKPLK